MTWIEFCWPSATGACLAMGLIHLLIGVRGASSRAILLFALNAFLIATYSYTELRMIHAGNAAEYLARLRWLDLASGTLTIALVLFVWSYFGTSRKWLGILGIACMGLSLTANLMPVPQLVFREFTGIHFFTTFGGATCPVAEGVPNPWNAVFYLSVLLPLLFVAEASITSWRRCDRRRATSRPRMPTAARISTSGRKHRKASKPTGLQPCRARDISLSAGFMGRPRLS